MKTVCVDLDGVLAEYGGWKGVQHIGDPIPGAREFMAALYDIPIKLCVWTTRTNPVVNKDSKLSDRELSFFVDDWLTKHDIIFDYVAYGAGKPLACAYVDDRAVVCRPTKDVENQDYDTALAMCRGLAAGHPLGAQGRYPQGPAYEDDEGNLHLTVVANKEKDIVRMDFGKPVGWIGMSKVEAIEMAGMLLKQARELK